MSMKRLPLRLLSFLTRWLWRGVVLVVIAAAVMVSAGREMAPLLSRHKVWLEANLSARIGEPVLMQTISAHWEGLVPELSAQQLRVGDFVRIDQLLLRVDLLASAHARALVFDTLELQHAVVKVPVGSSTADQDFNLRAYLEFLFSSADIRIRDLKVNLVPEASQPLTLHIDEVTVQNAADLHQLKAVIAIAKDQFADASAKDTASPFQLVMKFNGEASDIFSGEGRAHLALGDGRNIPELGQFLVGLFSPGTHVVVSNTSDASGQVWATWKQQHLDWVTDISLKDMEFSHQVAGHDPQSEAREDHYRVDFAGRFSGHVLMEAMRGKHYFLQVPVGQEMQINTKSYTLPALSWQYDKKDSASGMQFPAQGNNTGEMSIYIPVLKLPEVAGYLDLLPSEVLRDAIGKLRPEGELTRIHVTVPLSSPDANNRAQQENHLRIRANLEQVSVGAWEGAPALTQVDGYIEAAPESGVVELDSRDGFSMHYPLYPAAMEYQRASGRVYWTVDAEDQHIYVGGRQLDLHGEEGELHGEFWLDLPPHETHEPPELYLAVGLMNADAKFRNKYLPDTLDTSLKKWLDGSIQDGILSESGFIYRGSLREGNPLDRSLLFFGKVQNARLRFDQSWPLLDHLQGSLLVDNNTVYASIGAARFLDFDLSQGSIGVIPSAAAKNGTAPFLTIDADANGSVSALDIVRKTPLQKDLGSVFDGWQLDGDTRGHLQLGINIGKSTRKDFQEIDLHFAGNNLLVGGVDLPLQQLAGNVHYSSTKGLSSSPLTARLWGNEQSITLAPGTAGHGMPDVIVSVSGDIDPSALAIWAHLPLLHFLNGGIPVEGTISLPLDGAADASRPLAKLSLHSDLHGVAMDLPPPLKKTADEKQSLDLRANLWRNTQQYQINYGKESSGNLLSASVEQNAQGILKGNILLNQPVDPAATLPDQLRVHATLDGAILSDWVSVIERHAAFVKADREQPLAEKAPPAQAALSSTAGVPSFDVLIHQPSIGNLKMDETKLSALYHEDKLAGNYWEATFRNSMMAGRYQNFDDEQHRPELELDTVKIGEADQKDETNPAAAPGDDSKRVDPLADMVPQDLPALHVHAKQVILKGDDVGDWRFDLEPDAQGVTISNLFIAMPGMGIAGLEKNQGASMRWTRQGDEMHTEAMTHMNLSNQDGARDLFGLERIVEADKTDIQGNVRWQGSPAMISFRRLQGELSISSEKGRFLNSTTSTDLMRVINVFNFSAWARRLKLDFTDLYKKGVSYDEVTGRIKVDRGKVVFDEPLQLKGPSGRFELSGSLDSVQNTIDGSLIVTLPVNQNATWIAALAVGLPVAAGVWAVSKIFGAEIDKLSSVHYSVTGSLDEPKVRFENLLPAMPKDKEKAKKADEKKSGAASKDAPFGVED
jgi:uncharacterized protein (TIGR02099 family)